MSEIGNSEIDREIDRAIEELNEKLNGADAYVRKIYQKAYDKTLSRLFEERIRLQCYMGTADPIIQREYNLTQIERKKFQDTIKIKEDVDTDYAFITINPTEDITLEQIHTVMQRVFNKKWMTLAIYVIEQRGITLDELGKGMHIHLLVHRNGQAFSDVFREIANTVKHICNVELGRANKWQYGAYQCQKTTNKFLKNRLTYMLGKKKYTEDNQKDIKQYYDKIFREKFNLQDFYSKGDIETLVALCDTSDEAIHDDDV